MKNNYPGCSNKTTLANNDSTPRCAILTRGCTLLLTASMMLLGACSSSDDTPPNPPVTEVGSIYILNEGNFGSTTTASLSVYDPQAKTVVADLFSQANGAPFGETPTSMTIIENSAFVTITGSDNGGKITVINPKTGLSLGTISGLKSPRWIHVVSPEKAYVSNLWHNVIDIINPRTLTITGEIALPEGQFAEQFVASGQYVYTNLWSYGTKVIKIDVATNQVVASLEVGVQPTVLTVDKYGKLWTLTDGGYEGNPTGFEEPAFVCIDPATFTVTKRIQLPRGRGYSYTMAMAADGVNIFFVDQNLYKMSIDATEIPAEFLVDGAGKNIYGIGVNPINGELYIADAVDYMQQGIVTRHTAQGALLDTFTAGIIPKTFVFIPKA